MAWTVSSGVTGSHSRFIPQALGDITDPVPEEPGHIRATSWAPLESTFENLWDDDLHAPRATSCPPRFLNIGISTAAPDVDVGITVQGDPSKLEADGYLAALSAGNGARLDAVDMMTTFADCDGAGDDVVRAGGLGRGDDAGDGAGREDDVAIPAAIPLASVAGVLAQHMANQRVLAQQWVPKVYPPFDATDQCQLLLAKHSVSSHPAPMLAHLGANSTAKFGVEDTGPERRLVHLVGGAVLDITGAYSVADAQSRVAAARGVEKRQVLIMQGHHVLLADEKLKDVDPIIELSAVVRAIGARLTECECVKRVLRKDMRTDNMSKVIFAQVCQFYDNMVDMSQMLSRHCTRETCPIMCTGPTMTYNWQYRDGTLAKLSAMDYIYELLTQSDGLLRDAAMCDHFDLAGHLNEEFLADMTKMIKRFFRVYAHTLMHHYEDLKAMGRSDFLQAWFKGYLYFVRSHRLVSDSDLRPLNQLMMLWWEEHLRPSCLPGPLN